MAVTVQIASPEQLSGLLASSRVVVLNFHSESSTASRAISPVYDELASSLARPGVITFAKVNATEQAQIAQSYSITNSPTFIIFKNGRQISKVSGANPQQLSEAVMRLANEADNNSSGGEASGSTGGTWMGASLPRGYHDITDQVDVRGLDLLNADSDFGGVRTLFETTKPTSIGKGKGAAAKSDAPKDWVESDVDEQLMLYIPFTSTVKVHTIQLTSLPPQTEDDDDVPIRPKTVKLFTNRQHNLGFEEAEDEPATQSVELKASDWDETTGTAKLELRFVKFQNISSIVLFVVDGDGSSEKTRLDRVRIVGEAGEKRDMGKLEKIDHDS
ncbi:DUF1000-domain-containing protein [Sporormia fimetaria CBS 119925]|uniref:DUF1000-domain-containing protein n=1 Tax=Sporormia fimetaria CBS 119925 TaxID=1340428 RepID=A0A6A6VL48_9PLEO|nr:DUF1000-domain-containing protein [Sporormia fimetaria CBS 119925]